MADYYTRLFWHEIFYSYTKINYSFTKIGIDFIDKDYWSEVLLDE